MPSQRVPQFGLLALITYGLVGLSLAGAVGAYYYYAAQRDEAVRNAVPDTRTVQVGSIWVPAYPGAALHQPEVAERGDMTDGTMNFATHDAAAKVVSYFQTTLARTGYQTSVESNNVGGGTVQAVRQGGRMRVIVTVQTAREGADVTIRTLYRHASN